MPLWGFLLSFLIAIMWGASPLFVNQGISISQCKPQDVNSIRGIPFFLCSLTIALIYGGGTFALPQSLAAYVYIFLGVFFGNVLGDMTYFMSIRDMGVGIAVPIANSYPILVAVTSWLMLGEPLTLKLMWGIIIVVSGLFLLRFGGKKATTEESETRQKDSKKIMRGFVWALLTTVFWALSSPITKIGLIESGLNSVDYTLFRSAAFLLSAWLARPVISHISPSSITPIKSIPPKSMLYFAASGTIGLSVAMILYAQCLSVMPVAVVTAITSTSPLVAALFGHFVLKELLARAQWAGIALIILGSVVVGI